METPILDLRREPPEMPRRRWILWVAIPTGLLAGFTAAFYQADLSWLPAYNPAFFFAGLYVSIAVHEFAHVLVAKTLGIETGALMIGGFCVIKSRDRWIFRFNPRQIFSGFVKPMPKEGEYERERFAVMIAAGPIASLVFAVLTWAAWARWGDGAMDWRGSFFWGTAFVAVMNLVPFGGCLNRPDISRVKQLLSQPAASRSWIALLAIQQAETNGVRPRDWDRDTFETMLASGARGPENSYRHLLARYRCVDTGEDAEALGHLELALADSGRIGAELRASVFFEAAWASAMSRNDAGQARTWLERARALRKKPEPDSVHAVIAMCEARYEDAIRDFEKASAEFDKQRLDSGLVRFAKAKYAELVERCREQARDTSVKEV